MVTLNGRTVSLIMKMYPFTASNEIESVAFPAHRLHSSLPEARVVKFLGWIGRSIQVVGCWWGETSGE